MNRKVRTERRERFDEYRAPHGTTNALSQVSGVRPIKLMGINKIM